MSSWTTTVPNSVRISAPVGQTSRQPASEQCLHTSLDISQRSGPSSGPLGPLPACSGLSACCGPGSDGTGGPGAICSMKATCRQVVPLSPTVLSNDMPDRFSPSSGTMFHSLQATSQALQPMQTEVSVKKPIRAGCSRQPARSAGSPPPVRPGVLGSVMLISQLRPGLFGDAGPLQVRLHQREQGRPTGPAAGLDVDGQRLDLLDVNVRIKTKVHQVVGAVAGGDPVAAPVVGQPDLVQPPALDGQRGHAPGDHDPGLDRAARGDDRGPAHVLQVALGGQLR